MTCLVAQMVSSGGSVKGLQGVSLLHKRLPVNSEPGAVLSALRSSRLAARMLSLIHGAERRSVTHLVLSGAWRSRSCCIELLYFSASSSSGQSPSTVLHMAFTSDWNFSRLIRRMFREVTERFFLRGLDRLSEKKSDLWSDRRFSDTDTSWMSVESSAVTSQSRI